MRLKVTQYMYDYLSDVKQDCRDNGVSNFSTFKWNVFLGLRADDILRIEERELASFWFGFHDVEIIEGFMVLE